MKNRPQCKDIPDEVILEACDQFHAALRSRPMLTVVDGRAYISTFDPQSPVESLADRWPPKLIHAKMESMVRRGLLEYGVSVRTAWRKVQA